MEDSGARVAALQQLMAAKAKSGKSFSEIGAETGLTNVYVAQLLRRQAQLKPDTAAELRAAIPALTDDLVELMMQPPFRSYNPDMVHEPAIYRSLVASLSSQFPNATCSIVKQDNNLFCCLVGVETSTSFSFSSLLV
jgi:cyanate lyase